MRRLPLQLQQKGAVGFGELVVHELGGGDPAEVGDFDLLGLAGEDAGFVEVEADVAVGVGVDDVVDLGADLGLDGEFLAEFAREGGAQFLAGIDFAAGEFQ